MTKIFARSTNHFFFFPVCSDIKFISLQNFLIPIFILQQSSPWELYRKFWETSWSVITLGSRYVYIVWDFVGYWLSFAILYRVKKKHFHVNFTQNISPGAVRTEMLQQGVENLERLEILEPEDIANAIIYVIGTPSRVQIDELTITPSKKIF